MNYIARGAGSLYYLKFSRTGLIFIHFYDLPPQCLYRILKRDEKYLSTENQSQEESGRRR